MPSGSSRASPGHLRELHGRLFTTEETVYALPHDQAEYERLDKQHLMHKLAVGSLYIPRDLVHRALAPANGIPRSVVDIGTGSGIWAIEMAAAFPHVEVVGIDLAPQIERPKPRNCRLELGDFNMSLSRYAGRFDVAHVRSVAQAVNDPPFFMHQLATILKDDGVLLFVDGELSLVDESFNILSPVSEGQSGHSYLVNLFAAAEEAMRAKGASVDAGRSLKTWVERSGYFQGIGSRSIYTPISPWFQGNDDNSRRMNIIGDTMQHNIHAFIRSLRPLLLSHGFRQDFVDFQIAKADEEILSRSKHIYAQWHYCWAEKA